MISMLLNYDFGNFFLRSQNHEELILQVLVNLIENVEILMIVNLPIEEETNKILIK